MHQPAPLQSDAPLKWSVGRGTDVWALFVACRDGDLAKVRSLLAKDPALVRTHYSYRKPLYFAVRENRIEIVQLLLETDPDPFGLAVDDSMIEIARDRGHEEMRRLLESVFETRLNASTRGEPLAAARQFLDHGADLHARDEDICSTPLGWAAKNGRKAMVEFLLERGAQPRHPDDPPWATPHAWATRRGHTEIAALLEKTGA